jgi:hypothetical protein
MDTTKRTRAIIKYGFAAVGAALLIGGLTLGIRTAIFLSTAIKAEGVVVELREGSSSKATMYLPVVEFAVSTGEKIQIVSPFGSSSPDHAVGDEVAVFYDANSPHAAKIGDFMPLWGAALVLGIVGGVFFAIGAGIFLAEARLNRSRKSR